ncbi:MAG: hypothetical protein AB1609_00690 [Bacillota bacterium]
MFIIFNPDGTTYEERPVEWIILPPYPAGLDERCRRPILQVDIVTGAKLVDRLDAIFRGRVRRAEEEG